VTGVVEQSARNRTVVTKRWIPAGDGESAPQSQAEFFGAITKKVMAIFVFLGRTF
jgi:hypothetical protein